MKTNNITHKIDINNAENNSVIKIRLNDECKNGHEDFSITATFWKVGRVRNDAAMISGGCCHEEILKIRPDLKIFVDLHLADFRGVPMHGLANSMYHLQVGFNKTPITDPKFKSEFCDYYMIDPKHFDSINVQDKEYYKYMFHKLGIIKAWKVNADKAIKLLEKLTGEEFESKATRLQNIDLTTEETKEISKRIKNGYYLPDAIKLRESNILKEKQNAMIKKLEDDTNKEIEALRLELSVQLFLISRNVSLNNFIYYKHSNTGCFNWKSYEKKMTQEEFDNFLKIKDLPKINWELK